MAKKTDVRTDFGGPTERFNADNYAPDENPLPFENLPKTEEELEQRKLSMEPMLKHFRHDHLPTNLQGISAPFGALAKAVVTTLPPVPERTMALRKLLEAKDCAVRAALEL